jgi:RNA polymerase sigma-70 factor (ECF subfamily)
MARSTTPGRDLARDATRPGPAAREDLADLLALAARGDTRAFMRFYDLTCAASYRAALAICADRGCAEELTASRYARAWAEASAYPRSGLSPMAWLLVGITRPAASHASATATLPEAWARGA